MKYQKIVTSPHYLLEPMVISFESYFPDKQSKSVTKYGIVKTLLAIMFNR